MKCFAATFTEITESLYVKDQKVQLIEGQAKRQNSIIEVLVSREMFTDTSFYLQIKQINGADIKNRGHRHIKIVIEVFTGYAVLKNKYCSEII